MPRILVFLLINLCLVACQPAPIGWSLIPTETRPPQMIEAAVAYDAATNTAVLFGGITKDKWLDETWLWNGRNWIQMSPRTQPPAREKHVLVYDEARHRVVLFGGAMDKTLFDDTWEWDGNEWQQMNPAHKPPGRCCHAMAYDSVQRKVVLYGGWDHINQAFLKDTWLWDGTDWVEVTCCSAPGMSGHAMVGFPIQGIVLAVQTGGFGTWIWDGNSWENTVLTSPPDRSEGRLVYDSQHEWAVLFGGIRNSQPMNDLWAFDGTDWMEIGLLNRPSARYGHMMFYDRERQRIIMFGGYDGTNYLNDTWELTLPEALSEIAVTPTPTP
jgi:hypothetical protein